MEKITKKPLLIAVIMSFYLPLLKPYCITYVHIGKKLPEYFYHSARQARIFNETCPIYLLVSNAALQFIDNKKLSDYSISTIAIESLTQSMEHKEFIKTSTLNKVFRESFYFYASERFLVLDDFAKQFNIDKIIHLENDVMIYVDLNELMPTLEKYYQGIGAVFANDSRCIPGFIYFSKKDVLHELAQFFAKRAALGKNDMSTLAAFYKEKANDTTMDLLPVIMPEYIESYELKTLHGVRPALPSKYCNHIDKFNSIFDGAAIGLYLGGYDPRNVASFEVPDTVGIIHPYSLFNASLLNFEWKKDQMGRKIPYALFNGKGYRINNIHVHSKKLELFFSK